MKYVGKAEETANRILEAFKSGVIGKSLAPIFIHRKDNVPCRAWSWGNQLLCVLEGTSDARGFKQWSDVGRHVKKGSKAFYILVPLCKKWTEKDALTGEEKSVSRVFGFNAAPVFRIEDTEGDALPKDAEAADWIDSLPLIEVARAWGVNVDAYNGTAGRALGKFMRRGEQRAIALGVKNLSTWAHEFVHCADDRLGNLKEKGQHWRSETVAELGATILLESIGCGADSDRGGCWEYVGRYAVDAGIEPLAACMDCLRRTCDAVNSILTEAEKLNVFEHSEVGAE